MSSDTLTLKDQNVRVFVLGALLCLLSVITFDFQIHGKSVK